VDGGRDDRRDRRLRVAVIAGHRPLAGPHWLALDELLAKMYAEYQKLFDGGKGTVWGMVRRLLAEPHILDSVHGHIIEMVGQQFLSCQARCLDDGSNEMQRNIISERMLACHESWNRRKVHFTQGASQQASSSGGRSKGWR
jgi:hypothetical protein